MLAKFFGRQIEEMGKEDCKKAVSSFVRQKKNKEMQTKFRFQKGQAKRITNFNQNGRLDNFTTSKLLRPTLQNE